MCHVLLVEDYLPDVRLTQRAFRKAESNVEITHVLDGVEALDFLHKRGRYLTAATPDFILLDLNMPRKDGRQVLAEIRKDDNLKHIPVIVLTTSSQDYDVREAHHLGANAYVVKPVKYADFETAVSHIDSFWTKTAKLPKPTP